MNTPNTTGPSYEALALALAAWDSVGNDLRLQYAHRFAPKIDAALSRAREDARREALEEAAQAVEDQWWLDEIGKAAVKIIRALIPNTPQGETKEQL